MGGSRIVIFLLMLSVILCAAWLFKRSLERPLWNGAILAGPARLRFPLVSIKSRLPQGKPITPSQPRNVDAKDPMEELRFMVVGWASFRSDYLRKLHEESTIIFLESPGNGSGRVVYPSPSIIYLGDGYRSVSDQPGKPALFGQSPNETLVLRDSEESLIHQHTFAVQIFMFSLGWGYVRDLDHVAGFESHGFRFYSERRKDVLPNEPWRVDHVQLVGILTQPEPIVYLTDKMPSMEQIKNGTTRKLDAFEEKGLKELAKGDDLFIVEKDNTLRMLGALRATKSCLQCHDTAKDYDLMGAFSYTIRRNAAFNPADKPKDEGVASGAGL